MYWLHALIFLLKTFFLFAVFFLCTFISFTFAVSNYMRTVLFVVFITTLFLIQNYYYTIEGNICSAPFQLFRVHNTTSQFFKLIFYLNNSYIKLMNTYLTEHFSVYAIVRWVEDIFHIHKYWNNSYMHSQFHRHLHSLFLPFSCPTHHTYSKYFLLCSSHNRTYTFPW